MAMSEVSDRYATIAAGFADRLEHLPPTAWPAQTPCTEWTVRDLVTHVVGVHRRVLALLDGSEPAGLGPDDDLVALWKVGSTAVQAAVDDEATASRVVSGMMGDQPFERLVSTLLCTDTLVHTWDLARATGQDQRLDPGAVARSMEFLSAVGDAMRRPGGFGPKIEPAPDADDQTRFLNFAGRSA